MFCSFRKVTVTLALWASLSFGIHVFLSRFLHHYSGKLDNSRVAFIMWRKRKFDVRSPGNPRGHTCYSLCNSFSLHVKTNSVGFISDRWNAEVIYEDDGKSFSFKFLCRPVHCFAGYMSMDIHVNRFPFSVFLSFFLSLLFLLLIGL